LNDITHHSLPWVGSFRGSETDELSSSEREGSRDEYRANSFEAIGERSWILPEFSALVGSVLARSRSSSATHDDTKDDEHADDQKLEARSPEPAESELSGSQSSRSRKLVEGNGTHSSSAKPRVPKTLRTNIKTMKMVIQPAVGIPVFQ
jgi:hypothetical protein